MSIDNETESKYPKELKNVKLEYAYIGLLLENPKSISKYYLSFEDSQFSDPMAMNLYKSILFTEGGRYAPENIKRDFPDIDFSKTIVVGDSFADRLFANRINAKFILV